MRFVDYFPSIWLKVSFDSLVVNLTIVKSEFVYGNDSNWERKMSAPHGAFLPYNQIIYHNIGSQS